MSKTISELYEKESPKFFGLGDSLISSTALGFEHELEGVGNPPEVKGWRTEHDGSLRGGGIEYVFNDPTGGGLAEQYIKAFCDAMKEVKPLINERTSTHIHIDVRDLTMQEVGRFVCIYAVLEPVLFQMCDPSRRDNPYCVPIASSHAMMRAAASMALRGRLGSRETHESRRYCALNLAALRKYGSIEVRMRETIIDYEENIFWANIFLGLKQFVHEWGDVQPSQFVNLLSEQGVDTVFSIALTEPVFDEIKRRVPEWDYLIFTAAQELQWFFDSKPILCSESESAPEDNFLIKMVGDKIDKDNLLSYFNQMGMSKETNYLLYGANQISEEVLEAWRSQTMTFDISEDGANFYNARIKTKFPLEAGPVQMSTLLTKQKVFERDSVRSRLGRRIGIQELMTYESRQLWEQLSNTH